MLWVRGLNRNHPTKRRVAEAVYCRGAWRVPVGAHGVRPSLSEKIQLPI